MAVTLQQCLDRASFYLGENTTPTNQITIRTAFANDCKVNIRNTRNWSWELKTATIDIVSGQSAYALPSNFKDISSMAWVKVSDGNSNSLQWPMYTPISDEQFNGEVNQGSTDRFFSITGNTVDGFYVNINPLPTSNITGGLSYRYYSTEIDFSATTDTTRIPKIEAIAWYIAAKVFFGYREQAQYQLAINEYQDALTDMTAGDLKNGPNVFAAVRSFRDAMGSSTNFKNHY